LRIDDVIYENVLNIIRPQLCRVDKHVIGEVKLLPSWQRAPICESRARSHNFTAYLLLL